MKVLLISPRDAYNSRNLKYLMGGENTYTRNLLKYPPSGVKYVFYADALRKKQIQYTFFHKPLQYLIKTRILTPSPSIMCFEIKDQFDLIHVHGYSARLTGRKVPVILSDSSSNYLYLRDYLGWNTKRIKASYLFRKFIDDKLNIYDQNLSLKKAPLIVWSEFARRHHAQYDLENEKIIVIPPGIPKPQIKKVVHTSYNILFIGIDFKRKGGELLLKAYVYLKEKFPQLQLTIISNVSKDTKLQKDIYHKPYLRREKLIKKIYPKADVLVLVPPVAEGYGMVVLEAASFGIPAIVSSVYALPEIVKDGQTGFVIRPGSVEELIRALEKLITNRALREKMGKAAKNRFMKKFWIEKTNRKLLKVYQSTQRSSKFKIKS